MVQYKFKNNYFAGGLNPIPAGSKMAQFQLQKNFYKGDIVEGEIKTSTIYPKCATAPCPPIISQALTIVVDGALKSPRPPLPNEKRMPPTPYSGKATFQIPLSELEEVGAETRTGERGQKEAGKDKTIYYVIGGIILIGGIYFMATRKPKAVEIK